MTQADTASKLTSPPKTSLEQKIILPMIQIGSYRQVDLASVVVSLPRWRQLLIYHNINAKGLDLEVKENGVRINSEFLSLADLGLTTAETGSLIVQQLRGGQWCRPPSTKAANSLKIRIQEDNRNLEYLRGLYGHVLPDSHLRFPRVRYSDIGIVDLAFIIAFLLEPEERKQILDVPEENLRVQPFGVGNVKINGFLMTRELLWAGTYWGKCKFWEKEERNPVIIAPLIPAIGLLCKIFSLIFAAGYDEKAQDAQSTYVLILCFLDLFYCLVLLFFHETLLNIYYRSRLPWYKSLYYFAWPDLCIGLPPKSKLN